MSALFGIGVLEVLMSGGSVPGDRLIERDVQVMLRRGMITSERQREAVYFVGAPVPSFHAKCQRKVAQHPGLNVFAVSPIGQPFDCTFPPTGICEGVARLSPA